MSSSEIYTENPVESIIPTLHIYVFGLILSSPNIY